MEDLQDAAIFGESGVEGGFQGLCDARQAGSEVRVSSDYCLRGFGKGKGIGSVVVGVGGSEIGGSGVVGCGGPVDAEVAVDVTSDRVGSGCSHGFGGTFGGQLCIPEVGEKLSDMSNSVLSAVPIVPMQESIDVD